MTPTETILSSKFQEHNGNYYSNMNHKYTVYHFNKKNKKNKKLTLKNIIQPEKLRKTLMKDIRLYTDVLDYIDYNCSYGDICDCTKCLKSCNTLRDIKTVLNENYYYTEYETEDAWYNYLYGGE